MRLRKISLIIVLLLSVCAVFAQSTVVVTVRNNTLSYDYECSVQFNQSVTPNSRSTPSTATVWTVAAGTTKVYTYEFDVDDVNLEAIKCSWVSGGTTTGYISMSSPLYTTSYISPDFPTTVFSEIEYDDYDYSGTTELIHFTITH